MANTDLQIIYKLKSLVSHGVLSADELNELAIRLKEAVKMYTLDQQVANLKKYGKVLEFVLTTIKETREKLLISKPYEAVLAAEFEKELANTILEKGTEVELWTEYFEFVKKWNIQGSLTFEVFKNFHGRRPEMWKLVADLALARNDTRTAQIYLMEGVSRIPGSLMLHKALIELEISISKNDRHNKSIDSLMPLILAYERAMEQNPGAIFCHDISKRLRELPPSQFRVRVLRDIVQRFPHTEVGWDAKARLEIVMSEAGCGTDDTNQSPIHLREALKRAFDGYQEALKVRPTEGVIRLYVAFLTDLHRKNLLSDLPWDRYFESDTLPLQHLQIYANKEGPINTNTFISATERFREVPKFWHKLIESYIQKGDDASVETSFSRAIDALTFVPNVCVQEIIEIWKLVIDFVMLSDSSRVKSLYEAGCAMKTSPATLLRPMYLQWVAENEGIEEARKICNLNYMNHEQNGNFYKKVLELEMAQPNPSVEHMRNWHRSIVTFDITNPEVWIAWCDFEYKYGNKFRIPNIYCLAVSSLQYNQTSLDSFQSKWSKTAVTVGMAPTLEFLHYGPSIEAQ